LGEPLKRNVVRLPFDNSIMKLDSQLAIELVWEDQDLEELLISASNGRFSGIAQVYFGHGEIEDFANRIRGFPRELSHRVIFGNKQSDSCAELTFYCVDGVGHTMVKVSLGEEFQVYGRPITCGRVEFEMLFEPLALDSFWQELNQIAMRRSRRAVLPGIDDAQQALGADSP
jgi:hypothetical protein